MKSSILKCPECGKYSMADACKDCGAVNLSPHPPRYSPEDRYGRYRRKLKQIYEGGS